ncbi:cysteine desulfurase (plasmid) [Sphingomonadaceae bacterium OTU29MARTA1]|nr:cysteine desulfurase [Sphingomonadaceae bacterium OTU29MARTA1]
MAPFWREIPFNAHSAHGGGASAEAAVARARVALADLIGAAPQEIVFTSGATEANNLAILGLAAPARSAAPLRNRILTSSIEHKCVLEAARHLAGQGFIHEIIPVRSSGQIDLVQLSAMLDERVLVVAVMAANNEIGSVQPLSEIGNFCQLVGANFHVDAAQVGGRLPFDVLEAGCDTASLSAHKMYGPKGIGALYVSAAAPTRPAPLFFGGGQEQALRPGTLPVPLIVGFGEAAALAVRNLADTPRLDALADQFLAELKRHGIKAQLNGDRARRLSGSLNFHIAGVDADDVVQRLGDTLHLSTGSACQSGELQGSYVLRAIGLPDHLVSASFRLCFGHEHGPSDAIEAARLLAEMIIKCDYGAGRCVQWREETHGDVHIKGL